MPTRKPSPTSNIPAPEGRRRRGRPRRKALEPVVLVPGAEEPAPGGETSGAEEVDGVGGEGSAVEPEGPRDRFTPSLMTAVMAHLGGYKGIVLAHVIRKTWAAEAAGGDLTPCRWNSAQFADETGLRHDEVNRAKRDLIRERVLVRDKDGGLLPSEDFGRWPGFLGKGRVRDFCREQKGEPAPVRVLRRGYRPAVPGVKLRRCKLTLNPKVPRSKDPRPLLFAPRIPTYKHIEILFRDDPDVAWGRDEEFTGGFHPDAVPPPAAPEQTREPLAAANGKAAHGPEEDTPARVVDSEPAEPVVPAVVRDDEPDAGPEDDFDLEPLESEGLETTPPPLSLEPIAPAGYERPARRSLTDLGRTDFPEPDETDFGTPPPPPRDNSAPFVPPKGPPTMRDQLDLAGYTVEGEFEPDMATLARVERLVSDAWPGNTYGEKLVQEVRAHRRCFPSPWFWRVVKRIACERKACPRWPYVFTILSSWAEAGAPSPGVEDRYTDAFPFALVRFSERAPADRRPSAREDAPRTPASVVHEASPDRAAEYERIRSGAGARPATPNANTPMAAALRSAMSRFGITAYSTPPPPGAAATNYEDDYAQTERDVVPEGREDEAGPDRVPDPL